MNTFQPVIGCSIAQRIRIGTVALLFVLAAPVANGQSAIDHRSGSSLFFEILGSSFAVGSINYELLVQDAIILRVGVGYGDLFGEYLTLPLTVGYLTPSLGGKTRLELGVGATPFVYNEGEDDPMVLFGASIAYRYDKREPHTYMRPALGIYGFEMIGRSGFQYGVVPGLGIGYSF